jgi:hypothetical protein
MRHGEPRLRKKDASFAFGLGTATSHFFDQIGAARAGSPSGDPDPEAALLPRAGLSQIVDRLVQERVQSIIAARAPVGGSDAPPPQYGEVV